MRDDIVVYKVVQGEVVRKADFVESSFVSFFSFFFFFFLTVVLSPR